MSIDPNIKKKADDIRNKTYGKEVRESLASGLEAISEDVVENEGRQSVVERRQDSVESQWQTVSDEMTDKDVISAPEIIAARNGEANLKARLDKENQEVKTQLAEIKTQFGRIPTKPLVYGELKMPNDFIPTLPCTFYRDNDGIIKHNMDFNKYKKGIKIYVSDTGDNTTGDGSIARPYKSLTKALTVVTEGADAEYQIITDTQQFDRNTIDFSGTITDKKVGIISKGALETAIRKNNTKQYNVPIGDLMGTWIMSGVATAAYTQTVGDSFTVEVEGSEINFQHYADVNGGLFEFVVDGNTDLKKEISVYSSQAGFKIQNVFKGLSEGIHFVTATFLGASPEGGTRGWIRSSTLNSEWLLKTSFIDYSNAPNYAMDKTIISSNAVYVWTLDGTNTYKTARAGVLGVADVANRDLNNLPIPLKKVSTLAECQATAGTWYTDNIAVWVHRIDDTIPTYEDTIINIGTAGFDPILNNSTIYFENIVFCGWKDGNGLRIRGTATTLNDTTIFNNCFFVGTSQTAGNGLSIMDIKNTYLFNCIAAYAQLDGFNYHYHSVPLANRRECFALEYNCKAYHLGIETVGSGSNQASSAHEGISVLRIGTIGYETTGGTLVDVNGCYSILYDCHIRSSIMPSGGIGMMFSADNDAQTGIVRIINCGVTDANTSLNVTTNCTGYINNFKYDGSIVSGGVVNWV